MHEIVCFDKGGRDSRRALIEKGEAPRDFFYGTDRLQAEGLDLVHVDTLSPYRERLAGLHRLRERLAGRLFGLAYRSHLLSVLDKEIRSSQILLSFTDGFSLTLGNYFRDRQATRPRLIGCFHCLSDIEFKVPVHARAYVSKRIRSALERLDVIAFFGPADRDYAVAHYGLPADSTAIIRFGVDTDFWCQGNVPTGSHLFAIGQDPNRDFETLAKAETDVPIRIHTSLRVDVPRDRSNVTVSSGSYFHSTLTDMEVRDLYRGSLAVVVPLKDVFQPTGYSVTLQAMACGKPVILSRIKGLWAPELFLDGENCLLVEPGDPRALALAIDRLDRDNVLARHIGEAARRTIEQHFNLQTAADSTRALIDRALSLR
jgi:glycosyltransferase involved in cell wall biosynthesis